MKRILFWGAQCHSVWVKEFVFDAFERLRPLGWDIEYYFQPMNEYGLGYCEQVDSRPDWLVAAGAPSPVVTVMSDLPFSLYHAPNSSHVADVLTSYLPTDAPDIIITRLGGREYLSKIYPNVPILTMGDVFGKPWLKGWPGFSLRMDDDNCGIPVMTRSREDILSSIALPDDFLQNLRCLIPFLRLPEQHQNLVCALFDFLRQNYKKVFVVPFDMDADEVRYMEFWYDNERFQTKNDFLSYLLAKSDEDTCFIYTVHPYETNRPNILTNKRLYSIDVLAGMYSGDIDTETLHAVLSTANLTAYCDGLIIRNSKAYWNAFFHNKPVLSLGRHDIDFFTPDYDVEQFLSCSVDAHMPSLTVENVILFYWMLTRYRIGTDETEKLHRILQKRIASGEPNFTLTFDMFEVGDEAFYQSVMQRILEEAAT